MPALTEQPLRRLIGHLNNANGVDAEDSIVLVIDSRQHACISVIGNVRGEWVNQIAHSQSGVKIQDLRTPLYYVCALVQYRNHKPLKRQGTMVDLGTYSRFPLLPCQECELWCCTLSQLLLRGGDKTSDKCTRWAHGGKSLKTNACPQTSITHRQRQQSCSPGTCSSSCFLSKLPPVEVQDGSRIGTLSPAIPVSLPLHSTWLRPRDRS